MTGSALALAPVFRAAAATHDRRSHYQPARRCLAQLGGDPAINAMCVKAALAVGAVIRKRAQAGRG